MKAAARRSCSNHGDARSTCELASESHERGRLRLRARYDRSRSRNDAQRIDKTPLFDTRRWNGKTTCRPRTRLTRDPKRSRRSLQTAQTAISVSSISKQVAERTESNDEGDARHAHSSRHRRRPLPNTRPREQHQRGPRRDCQRELNQQS